LGYTIIGIYMNLDCSQHCNLSIVELCNFKALKIATDLLEMLSLLICYLKSLKNFQVCHSLKLKCMYGSFGKFLNVDVLRCK